ncbi:oxygen-independent coproporphyrinogen III oxidase [Achromobacter sp. GG226]|uniref:oxygen-independent coproporphyrinogen III oxidase n=1 Tax=Verticiella alkaliphila TaxID=2779529 RepID=UPI001C0CA168|nr:oxygen-independent coproporphyrinogen III oxidase [Verticiella sp. GG226]MBU4609295.1 oxygen-independent coproporphyrinogen III oxidase [Verticiella sp. GG226]
MTAPLCPQAHPAAPSVPAESLLAQFDGPGPRYTSYPTADQYTEAWDAHAYRHALGSRGLGGPLRPLSLYVHIPFCRSICYYCACNKVVTRDTSRAARYLSALRREADMVHDALAAPTPVRQLHLGGGTPTFLDDAGLHTLIDLLESRFAFATNAERSIEIDPRTIDANRLSALRDMGFNRVSFGVQDFDRAVQQAVHRVQPAEQVFALVAAARELGFASINVDLIYGLPRQSPASFARTLDTLVALAPDRIALYGYAHLPERFKPQRRIDTADLPDGPARVRMLHDAIARLTASGWDYIGMDHFARHTDSLAAARREGRLHRNFQGYTTHPDCDLVALGASAISRIGSHYAQNVRTLEEYYDCVENDRLPVFRGHAMNADDLLRHAVIMAIMCQGEVDFAAMSEDYLVDFRRYFQAELAQLAPMVDQNLVHLHEGGLSVTATGWFVVRAIARVFDRYAQQSHARTRFSRIL